MSNDGWRWKFQDIYCKYKLWWAKAKLNNSGNRNTLLNLHLTPILCVYSTNKQTSNAFFSIFLSSLKNKVSTSNASINESGNMRQTTSRLSANGGWQESRTSAGVDSSLSCSTAKSVPPSKQSSKREGHPIRDSHPKRSCTSSEQSLTV